MQIALITPSFPLTDDSCSGVFVERLAFHIAAEDDVQVITPATNQPYRISISKPYTIQTFRYAPWKWQLIAQQPGGIPVAFKQNRWLIFLLPIFLISLFAATIRAARKSDLIHANWAITGAIAGFVGKLTRTPVITTLRGSDISRSDKSWIDRQILRFCLKTSQKVITVCLPLKNDVLKRYPWATGKITSISNGVDEIFRTINRKDTESKEIRIISVGSLIPRKGMDTVIRAVASLKGEFDVKLDIVGGGFEYDKLLRLGNDLDLGKHLVLTGNVPASEVPDYLERADIFVLASYSEGRPNVLIEAMAAGVPVIASDIDGVTEIIEHQRNGLIFQAGDHHALSCDLKQLIMDSVLRNKLAEEARKFITLNNLSWTNCANQYHDLYNQIVNK